MAGAIGFFNELLFGSRDWILDFAGLPPIAAEQVSWHARLLYYLGYGFGLWLGYRLTAMTSRSPWTIWVPATAASGFWLWIGASIEMDWSAISLALLPWPLALVVYRSEKERLVGSSRANGAFRVA